MERKDKYTDRHRGNIGDWEKKGIIITLSRYVNLDMLQNYNK